MQIRRRKFGFTGLLLICCLGLAWVLAACGNNASPTTQPAAAPTGNAHPTWTPAPPPTATPTGPTATILASTPAPTPYITPLPEEFQPEITSEPPLDQSIGCTFVADFGYMPLSQQIRDSRDIVQVQVTNVGPLAWNTADGKAPAQACDGIHQQLSPVEITIKVGFKGQLTPATKLVLWQAGAPGSLAQGNYDYFPKNGDTLIYFLGDEENLRPDTPSNPLKSRVANAIYRMQPTGSDKWVSQITTTPFTLEWLKAVIKDPAIEPTPTPFAPPPTAYIKAGQTLQPTKYYGLDKAVGVYFKGIIANQTQVGDEKPGSDRFNRLVKIFDQPLQVLQNSGSYPYSDNGIAFGFELPDHSYASFVFYPDTNTLMHQLKDNYNFVELAAPDGLKTIFGL